MFEALFLEINCKERVQIILQMSPGSRGSSRWYFFQDHCIQGRDPNHGKKGGLAWRYTSWVGRKGWETTDNQSKEGTARQSLA